MKQPSFPFLFILSLALFLVSCKKEEIPDSDTLAAVDNAHAEALFGDAALVCDEAGYKNGPFTAVLGSSCAVVTYDSLNLTDPDTINIDFGTATCMCNDSSTRRGKMTVIYTGNFADSGSTHTVTFANYYTNDDRLSGSFTVTNNGPDSISGNTIFHIDAAGSVLMSVGGQINWYSSKKVEWTIGESTPGWDDNVYMVTGTASGSQGTGRTFISQIYTPILRVLSPGCRRYFTQGSIQIKPTDKALRTLEFGNGSCDNVATIAIDGTLYNVLLH